MRRIARSIVKKIAGYLKEVIDDELKVMDAFYLQYT